MTLSIMTTTVPHKYVWYIEGLLYSQKVDTPAYSENTFFKVAFLPGNFGKQQMKSLWKSTLLV